MSEENTLSKDEIVRLFNELTYRRYLVNKDQFHRVLKGVRLQEYIALYHISKRASGKNICDGKMYLEELSELLSIPMTSTSKMARKLQDEGLVYWTHDGDGSDGTYVVIAKGGWEHLEQQGEIAKNYYGQVLVHFGKDNMIELIDLLRQLDEIMTEERKKFD